MKYLPRNTEYEIDHLISNWISDLEKLNADQKIHNVNPVLVNILKAITRGQYTPEQLKADLEAYMTRQAFKGWHWTKQNEHYCEVGNFKYNQLITKEHEHGFI
jgi:hypothetical protein